MNNPVLYCIVCPFYGFWFHLWYLQTFLFIHVYIIFRCPMCISMFMVDSRYCSRKILLSFLHRTTGRLSGYRGYVFWNEGSEKWRKVRFCLFVCLFVCLMVCNTPFNNISLTVKSLLFMGYTFSWFLRVGWSVKLRIQRTMKLGKQFDIDK